MNTQSVHRYSSEEVRELVRVWLGTSEILGKDRHYIEEVEAILSLGAEARQEQFELRYREISQCFCSAIRKWRAARSFLYDEDDIIVSYTKHLAFMGRTREMKDSIKNGALAELTLELFEKLKRDIRICNERKQKKLTPDIFDWHYFSPEKS